VVLGALFFYKDGFCGGAATVCSKNGFNIRHNKFPLFMPPCEGFFFAASILFIGIFYHRWKRSATEIRLWE
ncbi:MAG TPA: hypothetical protein DCL60_03575, partial [Armatimonadetes bacterium]|nr:hypothetical protein [Armatimonadota bacterium]